MPLIPDERETNMALQLAAQSPFQGVDPGMIERFKADYDAMVTGRNVDVREVTRRDIQDEYIRQFYQVSGQSIPRWLAGPGVNSTADREAAAKKQVDQWRQQNPDSELPEFPTPEYIETETLRRASSSIRRSQELRDRSTSWSSAIGGFLGTVAGGASDPINMMALPFGEAVTVVRTALATAAVSAGSEAVIQGVNYGFRKQVEPEYGSSDAIYEIAAAGVGGAIIGGGIKGLADVWHKAKTGQWPSHIRDAANVVTREAAIPPSRFERSMRGETAHQAALVKSLDDLARGRPVELPPETFLEAGVRPGRVYDADGRSVGVRYEVVEADELVTSQLDNMQTNPAFPQELQPRDRSRAISQEQIAGIAGNLQPERLGFSPDASTGAPIVGPDGLVESGNGRVLALRRALQEGGVAADNYRNYLRSQNFDVDGFRNPVLVARRITDLEDRVAFVTAANRSTTLRMGAAEQAMADARLLDGDLIDRLTGSDITSADNQAFARGFMSKLPRAEQGNLVDKDGFLSQEGQRRMTSALMGRAYGEPVLLGRALEDTDNNIRSIAGALSDSSAPWARMRDAVARGEIPAGMDITDDLLNAVRLVMKARDEGKAVKDLVNQAEMFGGPDELSKIVARAMFSDADLKRPISRAKLSAFLGDYATEAMKNDAGPRLFGDPLQAPDILKSSLERVGRDDLYRMAEERLTPERIEEIAASPDVQEVAIMDAQRLRAERPGIMVDLGDGQGARSLDDILDEADDEIAAAMEIESCALGRDLNAQ